MELERPGATIHYERWGETGPLVVLVNGHTRPLNDFRMLGRHLVEQGFRVAALDNRGAGQTTTSKAFVLDDMADDVLALVEGPFKLLGISMGGFISQTVALKAPERVESLVLVSTASRQGAIRRDDTPWVPDVEAVGRKLAPYFTADFAQRNAMLVKSMAKQIAQAVKDGDYAVRSEAQKTAVKGFDAYDRLSAIKAPTLVVHGEDDLIVPASAGREMARAIPGARFSGLPGAGHLLLAERPKELYALVAAHFQGT